MAGLYAVQFNGSVHLNEHFSLSADEVEIGMARAAAPENGDSFTAWLDADLVGGVLTVRTRRAGDGFSPLGMEGKTVKLQDFYINVKLPRRARAGWPLVCAGEQIVWVPGFRLAHPFRITEKTQRALKLVINPVE
jgi:tRNA(Ile)-lysidine synthase